MKTTTNKNFDFLQQEQNSREIFCTKNAISTNNYYDQKIFYDFEGNIFNAYSKDDTYNGAFTFKLPTGKDPQKIISLRFPNASPCKVSWGSSLNRFGRNINHLMEENTNDFKHYASNSSSCSYSDLLFIKKDFELMSIRVESGADMRCDQRIAFNWFFDGTDYFIQVAYHQYAETWGSTVGGGMWLNLGTRLEIQMFNDDDDSWNI